MANRRATLCGPTALMISICLLWAAAGAQDVAQSPLSLGEYTKISSEQLKGEVLPRLYYSGLSEAKGLQVKIVQSASFPAVNRARASTQVNFDLNSVAIAIMDRVSEGDYLASSIGDAGSLERYMNDAANRIYAFAHDTDVKDWRLLVDQIPPFDRFYRMSTASSRVLGGNLYIPIRSTILTSAIGSVVVRETTEIRLAQESRLPDQLGYTEEFVRRAGPTILSARFDAVPASALVFYVLLKTVQEKPLSLDTLMCNEAKFQDYLQANRNVEQTSFNSQYIFSAGRRIMSRFGSCAPH
jgi:hypothetical protein